MVAAYTRAADRMIERICGYATILFCDRVYFLLFLKSAIEMSFAGQGWSNELKIQNTYKSIVSHNSRKAT